MTQPIRKGPSGQNVQVLTTADGQALPPGPAGEGNLAFRDATGEWVAPLVASPGLGDRPQWNGVAWIPAPGGAGGAVTSVFGRLGAILAVAGDYAASLVTNDSTVAGVFVDDALNQLDADIAALSAVVAGLDSTDIANASGVAGATVTAALDSLLALIAALTSTSIANASGVAGATVTAALNQLAADIAAIVSGVSSFNARTGAVLPAASDYDASQVDNDSGVAGAFVSDALDTLAAAIPPTAPVDSVFGRVGTVVALASDYDASQVDNDSGVAGAFVSDALDALAALIAGLDSSAIANASGVAGATVTDALDALAGATAPVDSVFGRTGVVVAQTSDYDASQVDNDSGVAGATVAGALDQLNSDIGALPTASAPANVTKAAATVGVSATLARSDHKHDIDTAAPVAGAVVAGGSAAEGTATTVSRSDHVHTVSVAAPVTVTKSANAAGVAATFSRSDHKHDIQTAAPAGTGVQVGNVAAEGSSTSAARSDHTHTVTRGVPVAVGTANAAGTAATFAGSDHVHAHGSQPIGAGTNHAVATTSIAGFLSAADKSKLDTVTRGAGVRLLGAADFDDPNNAGWAVNAIAPIAVDTVDTFITERTFDDTTEQGVGFDVAIPSGATNMTIGLISRAQTAPGAAAGVVPRLWRRQIPDNAAVGAWSAALTMTTIAIPTNANWQYDSQTISLATLGLTAGLNAYFELTRLGTDGADTLTGNWNLYAISVSFT